MGGGDRSWLLLSRQASTYFRLATMMSTFDDRIHPSMLISAMFIFFSASLLHHLSSPSSPSSPSILPSSPLPLWSASSVLTSRPSTSSSSSARVPRRSPATVQSSRSIIAVMEAGQQAFDCASSHLRLADAMGAVDIPHLPRSVFTASLRSLHSCIPHRSLLTPTAAGCASECEVVPFNRLDGCKRARAR